MNKFAVLSLFLAVSSFRCMGQKVPISEYMLTNEEFREIFDREARAKLGISGDEFVHRWHAGEYPDWDPELANLVMMLPFLGE